jgi:hypothetical protein
MDRAIRTLAKTLVRSMLASGYGRGDIVDFTSSVLDELMRQGAPAPEAPRGD